MYSELFYYPGVASCFFTKEGKEVSEFFSAEDQWATSPRSWRSGKPDIYTIDAIEDTNVWCMQVNDFKYLFQNFPEMDRYGRLSMGRMYGYMLDRVASLRFTSAKEKYRLFIKAFPNVHHRIPLGMIASYLGTTQETLSRIRSGQ